MAKIILKNVRGSYVCLVGPRTTQNDPNGKYQMQIIIKKDDPQVEKIKKEIEFLLENDANVKGKKKTSLNIPLKDGDKYNQEQVENGEEGRPELAGCYYMQTDNRRKPGLVNKHNEEPNQNDLEKYCYSGAYFHVSLGSATYPPIDGGKAGVKFYLNNVMLHKEGERLDGAGSAKNDFAEFAVEGEDLESDWAE